ncbi:MAG: J domain-containing protein [Vicinamibacterales bacterium]
MTEDEALRVLHLTPGCSAAQVRQAYRDLVKVWHPDRFPADEHLRARADRTVQELNEAYRTLRQSHVRRHIKVEWAGGFRSDPAGQATDRSHRDVGSAAHRVRFGTRIGVAIAIGAAVGAVGAVSIAVWRFVPGATVADESAVSRGADVKLTAPRSVPEPREPTVPRPLSGIEMVTPARTGRGSLVLHNAGDVDGVVVLADDRAQARAVYVRAGEQVTILNLAAGTYRVLLMQGRDWMTDRFTQAASYHELERPIEFTEREVGSSLESTRLTISLQSPASGLTGIRPTAPFRLAAQ